MISTIDPFRPRSVAADRGRQGDLRLQRSEQRRLGGDRRHRHVLGVNGDYIDERGRLVPLIYRGKTRLERHEELIRYSIKAAISQARIAHDVRGGEGRLHMNVLWEMGACERVLQGVLEGAKGLVHGVTCGAGMPYRLAEIAARYDVYYYPIVSSARAFRALWKRAYHRLSEWLGGVVYEDPWRAGGHNGLSNSENPNEPEPPYPRVSQLRSTMREFGLDETAIIMAGGVWHLRDWRDWLDNAELGPMAFQFGTRPLLTRESPISDAWKRRLLQLDEGDVLLHRSAPPGSIPLRSTMPSCRSSSNARRARSRSPQSPIPSAGLPSRWRSAPAAASSTSTRRPASGQRLGRAGLHPGDEDARRHPDLRRPGESPRDPPRSDRLHGLSLRLPVQQLGLQRDHTTGKPPDPRSFCIKRRCSRSRTAPRSTPS